MYKQAGPLDVAFGAMDAVDGAKRMKTSYNANNKYDDLMGTTVSKNISHKNGLNNAAISGNNTITASEELDLLYKQAMKMPNSNDIKRITHNLAYDINKIDSKNSEHIRNALDSAKSKDIKGALKEGLRASKVTIPAGLGMVGAGIGTSKAMKHFDKDRSPEKDLEYNTIGTGVTAGLLLNAMSNKKMLKPASVMAKVVGEKAMKYPLKVVKNSSKAGKVVADVATQVSKNMKNATRRKKASDELKDLEKLAAFDAAYGKQLFKEHFVQKGKESIPYYVAPAALSFMLGRDLRHGLKKNEPAKKPEELQEKTAKLNISPKMEGEIKMNLEKGVEGLGRTIFPASVMAVTGRDITNSLGKLKDQNNTSNMQNSMANGIIIQVSGDGTKRKIKRDVSKQLDDALSKKASFVNNGLDISDVAKNINKNINKMVGGVNTIKTNKIPIGNGVKKTFRMQK